MKRLSELYNNINNNDDREITGIKINSKDIVPGDLFVCVSGVSSDRHDYVNDAVNNGAVAIIASKKIDVNVPVVYVEDTNKELPLVCRKFYDNPDENLELIAVTGTNGKKTVAELIKDLIGDDICGYQGTNGITCSKFNEKIVNTTPDADRQYMYFDRFNKAGCKYLSMEVSSEAFYRHRVDNLKFKIGILTNVTEDHLNIHKTIENYVECKKQLFKQVDDNGYSILNKDSKYYLEFKNIVRGRLLTYGKGECDLEIVNIDLKIDKTLITLKYQDNLYDITSPLLGEFNVYNLCSGILALICLGYDINDIISRIPNIKIPHGRVEFLNYGQNYNILLDYAHTTDAFNSLYSFLDKVKTGRVITVTGSAGGREHEKRPGMGKLVLDKSDYVIFTMDDPRFEDVNSIIDDLVSDSSKTNYERVIDRKEAIFKAFDMACENDIVLIAGKGTDNYMALLDKYVPYCDLDVIKEYFEEKN